MKRELIETNDPQLTAYALGEMEPDEVAVFERQLADSPTAKAEMQDIRETVQWLRDGFATEAMRHADEQAKASVLTNPAAEGESKVVRADFRNTPTMKSMLLGLAAVLTGLLVVGALMTQGPETEDGAVLANQASEARDQNANQVAVPAKPEMAPIIQDFPNRLNGFNSPTGTLVKVKAGELDDTGSLSSVLNVPDLTIVDLVDSDDQTVPVFQRMGRSSSPGFADSSSYLDFEDLVPTQTLKIEPDKFNGLPGLNSIGRDGPGYGTFHFRNPDEAVNSLPQEDYGHGRMSFVIRKRTINGRKIETIRLTDHRVNPDGTEKVTVKEYTREGSEITPTGTIVPPNKDSKNLINLVSRSLPPASVPSIGAVEFIEESELGVFEQFQRINAELSAISQSMAKGPSPAELEALQERLDLAVRRQAELGFEIEEKIGN